MFFDDIDILSNTIHSKRLYMLAFHHFPLVKDVVDSDNKNLQSDQQKEYLK